jgi:hypothetical protein
MRESCATLVRHVPLLLPPYPVVMAGPFDYTYAAALV